MIKKIQHFFNEHRIAYWAGVLTIISGLFSIGGGLSYGAAKLFLNSRAQEYRIRDLETQLLDQNKRIEELTRVEKSLTEENLALKAEPNQDNLRKSFLEQPNIKNTKEGILDETRKVRYCHNCFQNNPMRLIPLQPYGLNCDEKCPVCKATYTSALSK